MFCRFRTLQRQLRRCDDDKNIPTPISNSNLHPYNRISFLFALLFASYLPLLSLILLILSSRNPPSLSSRAGGDVLVSHRPAGPAAAAVWRPATTAVSRLPAASATAASAAWAFHAPTYRLWNAPAPTSGHRFPRRHAAAAAAPAAGSPFPVLPPTAADDGLPYPAELEFPSAAAHQPGSSAYGPYVVANGAVVSKYPRTGSCGSCEECACRVKDTADAFVVYNGTGSGQV